MHSGIAPENAGDDLTVGQCRDREGPTGRLGRDGAGDADKDGSDEGEDSGFHDGGCWSLPARNRCGSRRTKRLTKIACRFVLLNSSLPL